MGYKCDVLQLSGVSNSEQEIFQTYLGPFNEEGEANQYGKSMSKYDGQVYPLQ